MDDDIDHLIDHHQLALKKPMLHPSFAGLVSYVATGTRGYLFATRKVSSAAFNICQYSTWVSIDFTRRLLVNSINAVLAARIKSQHSQDGLHIDHLSYWTINSVSMLQSTFSLTELLTMTTFNVASETVKFSLESAESLVNLFDGLFGDTETSKCVAAFMNLWCDVLKSRLLDMGYGNTLFGQMMMMGHMAKSMMAFCCLQYVTRKRWKASINLIPLYSGESLNGSQPSNEECQMLWLSSSQESQEENSNLSSDETRVDGLLRNFSISDLRFSDSQIKTTQHVRRRSVDALREDIDRGRNHYRSKTVPIKNGKEAILLFNKFELDQSRRKRAFEIEKVTNSQAISQVSSLPCKEPDFQIPDLASFLELAERISKFAIGAYGTNMMKILGIGKAREFSHDWGDELHNHLTFALHTNIKVEQIILSSFHESSTLHPPSLSAPVYYVVVDEATSSVIVSLRGTSSFSDLMTDLTAKYAKYCSMDGYDGFVHSGMLKSAQLISKSPVKQAVIEALNKYPTYSLILCGHSLGGGVASLLTLLWSRQINKDGNKVFMTNTEIGLPLRPIKCFVYAPPALMCAQLSRSVRELITCFVYRDDMISSLSIGLIRDFRNVTYNLWSEPRIESDVFKKVLGIGSNSESNPLQDEAEELWCWSVLKTLRADMDTEKLYPPGTILWINARSDFFSFSKPVETQTQKGGPLMTLHFVENIEIAFSEFTFSSTMFTDHLPNNYEWGLANLYDSLVNKGS